jgi:serine/threonine-protein kinase
MNDALSPNLRSIGRYTVLRQVRRGKASGTYIGLDPVMHREVVLKIVALPPPATLESGDAQIAPLEAAFVRQAQAAGKLHHPHIVTVFDAGRVHNLAYLAIERVAGRSLAELLAGGWRPEFVHCASIGARVADAIEYAHVQGLAHGHLGPQHVIVQSDGAPKVEGFGGWIDGGTGDEEALARTERLLPYFQNELTEEARRRDVRALAALLHMMLTGKAPQIAPDTQAPRSVLTLRPDVPPALARIVDDTLAPDHPAGHRTAGDLRDALTAYLWSERKSHVAPATIGIPLAGPPREPTSEPVTAQIAPQTSPPPPPSAQRTAPPADDPERTVLRPAPPPMRTGEPSLAEAGSDFVQLARRRAVEWLSVHRTAVATVAGLIGAGVVIGVLLAQFAGRAGPPQAVTVTGAPPAAQPPAFGIVTFEVAPWGEVLVDNKPVGVAPPLTELKLPAGRHTIEIRHGELPAVAATIEVDPAKPLRIRHRFQ